MQIKKQFALEEVFEVCKF